MHVYIYIYIYKALSLILSSISIFGSPLTQYLRTIYEDYLISFKTFFVWALLFVVHT